jgi:putative tricarboxylic transport membrane protein
MGYLDNIILGFQVILTPTNFLFCFIGVTLGTLVGVLPGIGPVGCIAILFPATFKMEATTGIIMMAGIWYGAMYGGSTTSILVNIPGEAASVITCLDGYQMARQGRAGPALGIAAMGSFIAGTLSVIGLMFVAIPLATLALRFGPPEYFAVICAAIAIVTYLARGSTVKALMMAGAGIIFANAGLDMITGLPRFTFGFEELTDGVKLASVAMGLFGISEVFINLEKTLKTDIYKTKYNNLWPSLKDWADSIWAILRGTVIGFSLGSLPGVGPITSSFVSYAVEKKVSKHPEKFGKGAIEGVAGPESANNAATGGNLISLLALGIPSNALLAMLYSSLIVHGIQPGPLFIKANPDIFWGLIASMYLGNVLLVVLNLPLIAIWVKVLKIPYHILFPLILLFCIVGIYSLDNSTFDLYMMLIFGVLGYLMRKFGYEAAPLVLTFVLAPQLESHLRRSLTIADGSFSIFYARPVAAVVLSFAILLLLSNFVPFFKKGRKKHEEFADEEDD